MRDPRPGPVTPRLRGVTHQWAFVASIFVGTALVLSAPSPRAGLAAAINAYVLPGWVGAAAAPEMIATLGIGPAALVAAGGVLYTAGAVIYARKRPDPVPAVFGYHEVFHVLVIGAAALHFAAIAFFVVPDARP